MSEQDPKPEELDASATPSAAGGEGAEAASGAAQDEAGTTGAAAGPPTPDPVSPQPADAPAEEASGDDGTTEEPAEAAPAAADKTDSPPSAAAPASDPPAPEAGAAPAPAKVKKTKAEKKEPTAAEATGVGKQAAQAAAKADDAAEHAGRPQPAARRRDRREAQPGVVVRAHAKYVRTSARKARLVCDHIRGKSVTEARAILAHTPRAVAEDWSKLLESAVANAEHNHELVGDELRILSVTADEGPTIKRFRPRAQGRASRINKRTAHLTIQLTAKETR